jgi:DNA-binding CsgD family transcriptional regulator
VSLSNAKESLLILFFIIIVIASGLDLVADLAHGADTAHILKESLLVVLSLFAVVWLFYEKNIQEKEIKYLKKELEQTNKNKADEYIVEGRRQLAKIISQQFKQWQLTQSETEIGLLLIKGLSLKEIAALRNTAEKTVRQQASAIYKKSNISGRYAFTAWFIEDIL